ncbi:MAG: hypothetical protein P8M03_04185 [Flavobacteriaceae bacterium]|nr:hypothetical protein [Flavobacteriaceae bacterium]
MNDPAEIFFTIVGAIFILIALYGAIKLKRTLLLSGICLFSILPIIGSSISYSADGSLLHLTIIMAFLAQVIITLPIKVSYAPDNIAATKIAQKIGLAIIVTNFFQAYLILVLSLGVPPQYGYFHIAIALIIIYSIIKSRSAEGA